MKRLSPNSKPSRRGAFLVVALICLVLATSMVGVLLSLVRTHHRQVASQQAELQAEWLSESALARAAFRLRRDQTYSGETWTIDAAELGGQTSAEVVIEVQKLVNQPDARTVLVKAAYGSGPGQTVRRARESTVVISQEN